MVDAFKVLGWLNAIDLCSHLSKEDCRIIETIGKLGLFDFRIEPVLERLRTAADSPCDPLRKAEVLLWCAAVGHARGWCSQAARDAREAVISCDADDHRRAAALWILGMIQWELLHNHEAHRNWGEARRIFKRCQNQLLGSRNGNDWYKDPIWQMEVELIARPEEIWTWLNCYHPSSLRPPTAQIVESVREKIRGKAYPNIYVLMQDLENANQRSRKVHERAEIYLEFGMATYQLGNSRFAVELLRRAVLDFYPGIGTCHKQVVARCMLGALEWMHTSLHSQAAADWLRCVDELEQLRELADQGNLKDKVEWYSAQCDILRSALLEWLEPSKRSNSYGDTAQQNAPKPSPPSGGKPCSYEDLLNMVRGNRAVADRLIELERKKSPTADRDELIEHAIEHLLPTLTNPDVDTTEQNAPKHFPLGAGKPCSYEDLLNMVRGDRAVADRLIELERKKTATADRNECIRRAIERWIRDNQ